MSFDIPKMHFPDDSQEARILEAIIDRDHVTVEEAIRRALRTVEVKPTAPTKSATKRKAGKGVITATELQQLRAIPTFAFFEKLPETVIDTMKAASKQTRAERFTSHG